MVSSIIFSFSDATEKFFIYTFPSAGNINKHFRKVESSDIYEHATVHEIRKL